MEGRLQVLAERKAQVDEAYSNVTGSLPPPPAPFFRPAKERYAVTKANEGPTPLDPKWSVPSKSQQLVERARQKMPRAAPQRSDENETDYFLRLHTGALAPEDLTTRAATQPAPPPSLIEREAARRQAKLEVELKAKAHKFFQLGPFMTWAMYAHDVRKLKAVRAAEKKR